MRYGLAEDVSSRVDGTPFPAQSSVLDEEALLSNIVKDFRIPTPYSCQFLQRGDSDIYRVKTNGGNFYLKVYRPPQTLDQTEAEARFVSAMSESGVPVVKPVIRKDDKYAVQVSALEGKRPMLLFEEAPPMLPTKPTEDMLTKVGEVVARVHETADETGNDFGISQINTDKILKDVVYYSTPYLSDEDAEYFSDISNKLADILMSYLRSTPDFGLCHADLVLSNICLTSDETIVLFDFGNAMKTWRTLELAIVYWSLGHRFKEERKAKWDAFLRGYKSVRQLSEGFKEQIHLMLTLRQISFIGSNCASLPLRLGTDPFEGDFLENQMKVLRHFVDLTEIL